MEQAEVERLIMKPTARRRLGKYVLLGRLGHGGMGKIYLAYLPGPAGIEKLLVIKRLHSHLTNDSVLVSSFLDEARLSMALSHPNIVHTYDVGELDGRYFMVMEHIDGQNLGVLLRSAKRSGLYPESHVWAGLFLGVLDGLHAAHVARDARGRPLNIIHRDVSPQNVLVTYDGTPKLVDFGIAKAAMRINETDAGVLKGKYAYMSPEQCEGQDLDARSDIFSAGIVLWEMLAGRRLYKSDSILRSVDRILNEPPISPTRVNTDADGELAVVVLKALQKKREDRFSTAEEFRDAVDEAMRKGGKHWKKQDIRDLMHRVFADVIERQRAVLDRCLTTDSPVVDDGEPVSVSMVRSHEPDSQSDLEVPSLRIGVDIESTTPSAFKSSPLITRDGDDATRPARKAPPPPPGAESPAAPVVAAPDEDRERRVGFVGISLALVVLLLALLGSGLYATGVLDDALGFAPLAADAPPPRGVSDPADTRAPVDAPSPAGTQAPVGTAPPVAGPSSPADADAPTRADPAPGGRVERAADDDDPVRPRRPGAARKPAKAGRDERDKDRGDDRRPDPEPTKAEPVKPVEPRPTPPPDDPPARVDETGFLTLDTVPWTTVFLNGKNLGNTPLNNLKVPAGELTLRLKNAAEGIDTEYVLEVKPGATTKKRLGLK